MQISTANVGHANGVKRHYLEARSEEEWGTPATNGTPFDNGL
jgi:hypothetical protein